MRIETEDEYDVREAECLAILAALEEYDQRVHPMAEPTKLGALRYRWDMSWSWRIKYTFGGALLGLILTLAWCVTR